MLELYFLFFDVVLGTFGPSLRLYERAGRSFNYYFYLIIFLVCGAWDLRPLALSYLMTVNLNYTSAFPCFTQGVCGVCFGNLIKEREILICYLLTLLPYTNHIVISLS